MNGDVVDPPAMARIREALASFPLRDRVLVELLAGSGLRRVEVCALNVEDAHLGADPHVKATRRKKRRPGEPEKVRIPARVADLLRVYLGLRKTGPLIESRQHAKEGKPTRLSGRQVLRIVEAVGEAIGLRLHPHGFRHYHGTAYQDVRKDPMATMRRLGHEDVRTTGKYMDGWGRQDRQAVEAVDALPSDPGLPSRSDANQRGVPRRQT